MVLGTNSRQQFWSIRFLISSTFLFQKESSPPKSHRNSIILHVLFRASKQAELDRQAVGAELEVGAPRDASVARGPHVARCSALQRRWMIDDDRI